MPTQNRIGREKRAELLKSLAAEDLSFDRQSAALVIVQQEAFLAQFLSKDLVFGSQVFDEFLLFTVDPASENEKVELPGLEKEFHQ